MNEFTYSHYEKITIPTRRNWFQKLMRMPKELSIWQRRIWTGSLEDLNAFSRVMHNITVDSGEIKLTMEQLENNPVGPKYIKTTGHKVES